MNKLSHSQLADLVVQAQQGDEAAFAALYAATVEKQLYFATAFLKDSALAEDAVQEVYLSLYKNMGRIKRPQTVVAYLNQICYNTCVDYREKAMRRKGELYDEVIGDVADDTALNNPDDRYTIIEQGSELMQALSQLEDHLRAAFLLRYYHNLKIHEISTAMGCSESTVKRYVKSARLQLKTLVPNV